MHHLLLNVSGVPLAEKQSLKSKGEKWSLWMSQLYPRAQILAIANATSQKAYIDWEAGKRGLLNLQVETADVHIFETDRKFDRVVSIEIFEHMKNYQLLL
jgi:cyclopropane-fatty-acyl-phospholipid synthase